MTVLALPVPTPERVHAAAARFDEDQTTGPADRVLRRVFSQYPANVDLEDILVKVVLLNGLYATNVFALTVMASHIHDLQIDPQLAAGSVDLVDRIACVTIRAKKRRHYSFATKYCSWHRPYEYPIFDSLVEKLLWAYSTQHHFAAFTRPDLQEYSKYKSVLIAFKNHFGLGDLSFKELDKFLWYTSRSLAR